ncbi:hypothetical protein QVD17_36207 [Tagetes erecta]|uniref:Transmembrane protein n=1 Tax=Tagetes erecta TaxID=13708 RepID=A0AAD8JTY5_TARER|nr:hypothetical protein QVD17_36207 [Tagetes erecta]
MLGLKSHPTIHQISSIQSQTILKPIFQLPPIQTHSLSHPQLKLRTNRSIFKASFSDESNSNSNEDEVRRVNLKWSELVLDPDRDNVVAVGLTGALVLAVVQVMWKLFVVTMATLIAAVKYTVVGVVLIFVVITLL